MLEAVFTSTVDLRVDWALPSCDPSGDLVPLPRGGHLAPVRACSGPQGLLGLLEPYKFPIGATGGFCLLLLFFEQSEESDLGSQLLSS